MIGSKNGNPITSSFFFSFFFFLTIHTFFFSLHISFPTSLSGLPFLNQQLDNPTHYQTKHNQASIIHTIIYSIISIIQSLPFKLFFSFQAHFSLFISNSIKLPFQNSIQHPFRSINHSQTRQSITIKHIMSQQSLTIISFYHTTHS